MKKSLFDAPKPLFDNEDEHYGEDQPIIPPDDDSEDIGVALTPGRVINVPDTSAWGIFVDPANAKIFTHQQFTAKRYAISSTSRSFGSVEQTYTVTHTRPSNIPSGFGDVSGFYAGTIYNNEVYLSFRYYNATTDNYWIVVDKYNLSFVRQSNVFSMNVGSKIYEGFAADATNLYFAEAGNNDIDIRSISTGAISRSFSIPSGSTTVVAHGNRIYVPANNIVKAYTKTGTSVTADDTTISNLRPFKRGGGVICTTLYFSGRYSTNFTWRLFRASGVPETVVPVVEVANATWGTPAYCSTSGKLEANLTFDRNVTGIAAADFTVQERKGTAPDYTWDDVSWTFDTPPATASANSAIAITVRPPANTNKTVRLRLKMRTVLGPNAQSPNSPASNADSVPAAVNNQMVTPPPTYTATWGMPDYTSDTRVIEFGLTLSEDPGSAFSISDDFDVEKLEGGVWQTAVGWTLTFRGTGTSRTIIATPATTVMAGTYRVTLKEDAFGDDKPSADTSSSRQVVGAYVAPGALDGHDQFRLTITIPTNSRGSIQVSVNPRGFHTTGAPTQIGPAIRQYLGTVDYDTTSGETTIGTSAAWSAVSFTGGKLTGTLTFNANVTGIEESSFEIVDASDIPQTGWDFDTPPTMATANTGITIAATPPAGRDASYRLRLKSISVIGPNSQCKNAPLQNVDSDLIPVDNRTGTTTITFGTPIVRNNDREVRFPLTFSSIGSGLEADDFSVSVSNGTWLNNLEAGTGGSNTRTFIAYNTETVRRVGSIQITINENAFIDRTITGDRTSPSASYSLSASTAATVTITIDRTTNIRWGQKYSAFFVWDRDVTGFEADDIIISAGEKGELVGSGREYKINLTAPTSGIQDIITVRRNAVNQTNAITRYSVTLGTGPRQTPTVLESTRIVGDGLTYTPDDLYTIAQTQLPDEATPRIRTYTQAGVLQSSTQTTIGGLLDSRFGHKPAIEILDNRFLMSIHRHDRFGIARADLYVDSLSFDEYFIDVGAFVTKTSETTATEVLDLAIGVNRIYALSSSGSFEAPAYSIDIYDLNGDSISRTDVDVNTQGLDTYGSVPASLMVTSNYLYLGFASLRSMTDAAPLSGDSLFAYTLDGDRNPNEDIGLTDISGTAARYGIKSMDWDETNQRIWMLVDRGRVESDVNYGYLATLSLPLPVDCEWATIEPQTLRAGATFDLKDYASDITRIIYAPGIAQPSWVSLNNNGVVSIASTGLPSTNTTARVSFIGIGSGNPAYISFDINLLRQTPTWMTIPMQILERGDTVDLNQFITGADTISFRSGHTVPLGLTIEDGVISVPSNANTSAATTVNVSGTNPIGTAHASFSLQIVNSAIDIRDLSFQQTPVQWRVNIRGIDISEHVKSVDNIFQSLDLYDTGEFLASECTIILRNALRLFQRGGPFYSDNSINPYTDEIIVTGRLGNVTRRLFTGILWGITETTDRTEVSWLCLERTRVLQNTQVVNFGTQKYDVQLTAQDQGPIGTYTIPEGLTPIADESLAITTEGRPMNVVVNEQLRIFGQLEYLNAKQTDTTVNTEGGLLETAPIADVKSPLTYMEAGEYIDEFLAHEGIINRKVIAPTLPTANTAWYESVGRAGFSVEHTDIQRYAKDQIYNSSNKAFYILAGSPTKISQDYLWKWTPETDEWELLAEFDSDLELWQLASADYNVFYILGTEARDDLDVLPNGTYDSSEAQTGSPSLIKIWSYTASTDTMSEYITGSNSYPPTLGHFYSVGFSRENANSHRFGFMPDTRGGFSIRSNRLYYRYATGTHFGIASVNLGNGTTSQFVNAGAVDTFGNAGGLAFNISGSRMYFGYTRAPSDPAELTIASRSFTSSTITTITTLNDPTDGKRFAYTGVLEIFVNAGTAYFVTQRHPRDPRSPNRRQYQNNADAVLYSVPTSASSTATVLKTYPYTQLAARSFVLHNGSVHFFEGSPAAYKFPPQKPFVFPVDSDTIEEAVWKDKVGFLKKVNGSTVEDVGLVWRSVLDNPNNPDDSYYGIHGAMCSPMISADGTLYMIAGYGNFDLIGQPESEISHVYNDAIIQYGTDTKFRIPQVETNAKTVYDLLQEIANSTNSVFGVDNQRFFWKTRLNIEAQLSSALTAGANSLNYDNATADFADSGFLRIGNEVMSYTGRSASSITGLTRGIAGTSASAHNNNASILHIDHVIYGKAVTTPVKDLFIEDDYTNLYNSIFVNYGAGTSTSHREDLTSINLYGRRERSVETFLHFTQIDWANSLADSYLKTFKDLEHVVRFNSNLALFLNVGDVIYLESEELSAAMRIYELGHDFRSKSTNVTARTISY